MKKVRLRPKPAIGRPKGVKAERPKPKAGPGRPKIKMTSLPEGYEGSLPEKEIDLSQVLYWMELQATADEIAGAFRVTDCTLNKRLKEAFGCGFQELSKRVGGQGKLTLRRMQFRLAEKSATMGIWLGKQWLGQKDRENEGDKPVWTEKVNLENQMMLQAGIIYKLEAEVERLKGLLGENANES